MKLHRLQKFHSVRNETGLTPLFHGTSPSGQFGFVHIIELFISHLLSRSDLTESERIVKYRGGAISLGPN